MVDPKNNESHDDDVKEHDGVTFEVEEPSIEAGKPVRHKGVYILPNLFTTGALFSAFYAIIAAMNHLWEPACIAIFAAMILDGLDGRVARLTNTQSAFGAEYDSLSDCVAFGVAPALVVYAWSLSVLGKIGWMVAFIYAACAALRLARFNVQIDTADKRFFTGLPSPSAAAVVTGLVWAASDFDLNGQDHWVALIAAAITAMAGLLMVSNFKYNSFKEIDFHGRVPFVAILIIVFIFAIVFTDPPRVLWLVAMSYAVSGPLLSLRRKSPL
ncbi:MAG TPA: CDP-diacylglycerol--serine O-phosphatidyltransferase [Pseudomonadales bacterium]|nr:CDP-diacylglycerol--serine O-phosphatidyltransferase [Pseudomonadales bacterium]